MPISITRHFFTAILTALTMIAMASVVPVMSRAQTSSQGDGHALHHDWYRDLKTKSGWSCCNGDERTFRHGNGWTGNGKPTSIENGRKFHLTRSWGTN